MADHVVKTTGAVKISGTDWDEINQKLLAVDKNGYVLDGFPKNRRDCINLQENGHIITNMIALDGSKEMLLNRQNGKKRDPGNDFYILTLMT